MMATENNQCFNFKINESDELNRQKFFNSSLIKELRKYREENIKLKHEKEFLTSKIKKLEEENKTLRSNLSSIKNKNPHEETMEIVENILHSNDEIKDEPLDFYNLIQKFSNNCESCDKTFSDEEDLNLFFFKLCHKCEYCGNYDQQNTNNQKEIQRLKIKVGLQNTNITCQSNIQERKKQNKYTELSKASSLKRNTASQSLIPTNSYHLCDICETTFSLKRNLKRHKKVIHEGKKLYPCKICQKTFSVTKYLERHISVVHEGQKGYVCDSCGRVTSSNFNLKKHIKTIHQNEKKFVCDICGKIFRTLFNLKRHSTVHNK